MRMTIKLVNSDGHACGGPSAVFDEQGGTIGRRVDCTLVIPDKDRHVSRVHALVQYRGDYFAILDKGSFLPVIVNGMRVGQGNESPIFEGDFIQIGTFGMRVEHVETAWDLSPEGRRALGVESLVTSPPGRQAAASELPVGTPAVDAGAEDPDIEADAGDGLSPDGDANAARPKRTRRKSAARPRGKGGAGRGTMDNPESTYEPGGREEPVEQVEALLSRLGEVITSTIAVPRTTSEAPPEPAGENRPAFSTFDLLADRLQAGDEQLHPFMPAVWDDPAGQPSAGTGPAAEGAHDHLAAMREIAASVTTADAAATEAEPAPVEAAPEADLPGADLPAAEAPSVGVDALADDGPVPTVAVIGAQAAPESAPESAPEAGNVVDAAPEVPRLDDLVSPGAHQGAAAPAGTSQVDAPVTDAPDLADDVAILERVVRRRRRRAAIAAGPAPVEPVSDILVDVPASIVVDSTEPLLSEEPAIVLVMQPVHGGSAGTDAVGAADYAIPVRRRNRRQPASAAGAVRSAH